MLAILAKGPKKRTAEKRAEEGGMKRERPVQSVREAEALHAASTPEVATLLAASAPEEAEVAAALLELHSAPEEAEVAAVLLELHGGAL